MRRPRGQGTVRGCRDGVSAQDSDTFKDPSLSVHAAHSGSCFLYVKSLQLTPLNSPGTELGAGVVTQEPRGRACSLSRRENTQVRYVSARSGGWPSC